jgi:hypothetical protein
MPLVCSGQPVTLLYWEAQTPGPGYGATLLASENLEDVRVIETHGHLLSGRQPSMRRGLFRGNDLTSGDPHMERQAHEGTAWVPTRR